MQKPVGGEPCVSYRREPATGYRVLAGCAHGLRGVDNLDGPELTQPLEKLIVSNVVRAFAGQIHLTCSQRLGMTFTRFFVASRGRFVYRPS